MEHGRGPEKKKTMYAKPEITFPNHILEEMIIEILSRLPLKCLVRFMCVSRLWCSYVKVVQPKNPRQRVLLHETWSKTSYLLSSINEDDSNERIRIPLRKRKHQPSRVLGSCNGLLLLGCMADLYLWNPLTRDLKKVMQYFRLEDDEGYRVVSGLCYDSSNDEYKAVMALASQTPRQGEEFVVVGSFQDRCWTEVHFPYIVRTVNSGPVLREHLHWYVCEKESSDSNSPQRVVSFNPRANKFNSIPMPQPKDVDGDTILGLGALDGCLCMVRKNSSN